MSTRASKKSSPTGCPTHQGDDALALSKVMPHHRVAWRVERIGWTVIALTIVAALLGLLGDGPLSRAHAGSDGLAIEYDRLQRSGAPTEYRFDVAPALARDGRVRLRFDQALVDEMEIDAVIPEPEAVIAGDSRTEFVFLAAPGDGQARITFRFRPATFGRRSGRIDAPGAPPLEIDQFIYP